MGRVLARLFQFGVICWRIIKRFCQYMGVASGIVGLYVIINLGIGFASIVEPASPPSADTRSPNILRGLRIGEGNASRQRTVLWKFKRIYSSMSAHTEACEDG
jgi:hypothetical protein